MKKLLTVLIICLLSACASQNKQSAEVDDSAMRSGGSGSQDGANSGNGSGFGLNPLRDPNNILSQRSVYYDYDSYTIKSEYRELVLAHARYLRDNGDAKVLLQGNTDERGSREYNLALGQKRANSVKNAMLLSGARDHQIEAVSLGEEKPRATEHGESAWAENRRADILYQGEY